MRHALHAEWTKLRTLASTFWLLLAAAALTLALVIDAGWWTYQRFFYPDLRVTFLSVGEGDGAVVRFPRGPVMLIDGGGSFGGILAHRYGPVIASSARSGRRAAGTRATARRARRVRTPRT